MSGHGHCYFTGRLFLQRGYVFGRGGNGACVALGRMGLRQQVGACTHLPTMSARSAGA